MQGRKQSSREIRFFMAGVGTTLALAAIAACSANLAGPSELDSYETAVQSQTTVGARAFMEHYRGSHLAGDLIESLRPDVALRICAELPAGASGRARSACWQVEEAAAAGSPLAVDQVALAAAPGAPLGAPPATSGCDTMAFAAVPIAAGPTANDAPRPKKPVALAARSPASKSPAAVSNGRRSSLQLALSGRGGKSGDAGGKGK